MSAFGFDPELPAGFQDADLEARELEAAAAAPVVRGKDGRCGHGWYSAPMDGPARCHDCGLVFKSEDALLDDAERNAPPL